MENKLSSRSLSNTIHSSLVAVNRDFYHHFFCESSTSDEFRYSSFVSNGQFTSSLMHYDPHG